MTDQEIIELAEELENDQALENALRIKHIKISVTGVEEEYLL